MSHCCVPTGTSFLSFRMGTLGGMVDCLSAGLSLSPLWEEFSPLPATPHTQLSDGETESQRGKDRKSFVCSCAGASASRSLLTKDIFSSALRIINRATEFHTLTGREKLYTAKRKYWEQRDREGGREQASRKKTEVQIVMRNGGCVISSTLVNSTKQRLHIQNDTIQAGLMAWNGKEVCPKQVFPALCGRVV